MDEKKIVQFEKGIRELLVTGSHRKAAEAAECNLRIWHQWKKTDEWKALFDIRREQAAVVSMEKIGTLFHEALDVFHEAMGEQHPMDIRLKAAQSVVALAKKNDPAARGPVIEALSTEVSGGDAAAELRRRRELKADQD